MIGRCTRPSHCAYPYYGAKGVKVCERWLKSFTNFYNDMGARGEGMTLDRFPNRNGNYEPGNCRWADSETQGLNKDCTGMYEFGGVSKSISGWSKETGLPRTTLRARLQRGWTTERALTTPKGRA